MRMSHLRRLVAVAALCLLASTAQATFISPDHDSGGSFLFGHQSGLTSHDTPWVSLDHDASAVDWGALRWGQSVVIYHDGRTVGTLPFYGIDLWRAILNAKLTWLEKISQIDQPANPGGDESNPPQRDDGGTGDDPATDVPAPGGIGLFLIGLVLAGLGLARRRRLG